VQLSRWAPGSFTTYPPKGRLAQKLTTTQGTHQLTQTTHDHRDHKEGKDNSQKSQSRSQQAHQHNSLPKSKHHNKTLRRKGDHDHPSKKEIWGRTGRESRC
jgi:hypothetical protein